MNALSGCQIIEGDLTVDSSSLVAINGLSSINTINGSLTISNNYNLNDLNGFGSLSTINGSLTIKNNQNLQYLYGLGQLRTIKSGVNITANPNLMDLSPLGSISNLGSLTIESNYSVTTLGFGALSSVQGDIAIGQNQLLNTTCCFGNLTQVGGSLKITNNNYLTEITSFSSIQSIGGILSLEYNPNLTINNSMDFKLLSSLSTVGSISIVGNPSLNTCAANELRDRVGGTNYRICGNLSVTPTDGAAPCSYSPCM